MQNGLSRLFSVKDHVSGTPKPVDLLGYEDGGLRFFMAKGHKANQHGKRSYGVSPGDTGRRLSRWSHTAHTYLPSKEL